jgi:hypothetical protein
MNENAMDKLKAIDGRYEAIAWGLGLAWIGVLGLIPGSQNDIGLLSIGLILLGLNLARFLSHIPTNGFTILLGMLFSALGLAVLLRPLLNLPRFEVDFLPVLLIVIGLYFLMPTSKRVGN